MTANLLSTPIKYIKGVGPKLCKAFEDELGIYTYLDLLNFYPYRYIDRTRLYTIREISHDMPYIQLRGIIRGFAETGYGSKKRLTAIFKDDTGAIELVWFRSISQIQRMYTPGKEYLIFGKPSFYNGSVSINHPEIDDVDKSVYIQGLMPIYVSSDKKKGISNRNIRNVVSTLIDMVKDNIEDPLPQWIRARYGLMCYKDSLLNIHNPPNAEFLQQARRRMKFEELFFINLSIYQQKVNRKNFEGYIFNIVGNNFNKLYNEILPFDLTDAQKRVIKEIYYDCNSGKQMNRLIQGDVGCGKTLVALFAMLMAVDNGCQACMMAPTEILAQQHFESITDLLSDLDVDVRLLTGSTKLSERRNIFEALKGGKADILIGTHAIIEDNVEFSNLGIAVIDEQHRFGVQQRSKVWSKNDVKAPHILIMSATPIPRTLAMTLYGDLDVSVIDELPSGRKPIKTYHYFEDKMYEVFEILRSEINKGRQVYVVYPMIEENESQDFKDLETGFNTFSEIFPQYNVAMIHGKMKSNDKDTIMNSFKEHKIDILLSTTVIEVGVNVPNASVMVIESANRFGLSQLHQLRGRVGRGANQSYCILVSSRKIGDDANKRLSIMVETNDGFEIAEEDMKIRGFGDIEGTKQSGQSFSLRIANLSKDSMMVQVTKDVVEEMFNADPNLEHIDNRPALNRLALMKYKTADWSKIS